LSTSGYLKCVQVCGMFKLLCSHIYIT
jgi:hypothetical protein